MIFSKFIRVLQESTKQQSGTYAGFHFSNETKDGIMKTIEAFDIPNATSREKLHTTLLYSRKNLPNYKALGKLDPERHGTIVESVLWNSQPDEDGNVKRCLVLLYDCKWMTDRHHKLLDEHNATYDFDYQPHITLSYDVGKDFDEDLLSEITEYASTLLNNTITITEEYYEPLNTDWADNSTE